MGDKEFMIKKTKMKHHKNYFESLTLSFTKENHIELLAQQEYEIEQLKAQIDEARKYINDNLEILNDTDKWQSGGVKLEAVIREWKELKQILDSKGE